MKKKLLIAGFFLLATSYSGIANAGGHYVCPQGDSPGGVYSKCWWADDNVEYRGKPDAKPRADILKTEQVKAKNDAAKLEGKALLEAANGAMLEAQIAQAKVAALNNRVVALRQEQAENKKKGIKSRNFNVWYGNCMQVYNDWGVPLWWRCF